MTTMLELTLETYGLNKNEIKVFLALVELGGGFAKEIIEKTKFHKNIIYDNIYKLIDKGLVSETLIDNKKYFECENPQIIDDFIEKTQNDFKKYKQEIEKLKEKILEKKKIPTKTQTRMYSGIEGVKQVLRHTLDNNEDYLAIGAPKESVDILGKLFWRNFAVKQADNNIRSKLIFNESLRNFTKIVDTAHNEIRFLKDSFEPLTEIMIYGKFVATIVWSKEPIATLIENEEVAQSYKKYFNILWKQTKK